MSKMGESAAKNKNGDRGEFTATGLPMKPIPGSYGMPFISSIFDSLSFYYFRGHHGYFADKIRKSGGATVLRLNVPPGHFIASDPRVVAVLDAASFRVLLDSSLVDKTNTLTGTYVPSSSLYGGHRPLAYLDTAEPLHSGIKNLVFRLLARRKDHVIPAFHAAYSSLFDQVESKLASGEKSVVFNEFNEIASFDFTCGAMFGGEVPSIAIGPTAAKKALKWLLFQLHPLVDHAVPLPWPIEHFLLHTFKLPFRLISGDYEDIKKYFAASAAEFIDEAESELGIDRDAALHNAIFFTIFNAFGGIKIFLPVIMSRLCAAAGSDLHSDLVAEIRSNCGEDDEITPAMLEKMTLTKSFVWECLRMDPPVEYQYGRARRDLIVESHDAGYKVKKGEMIFGYQPFATRDERVFENGGEFVARRFVEEEAKKKLLPYVLWSNGKETEQPSPENKQCPGKDMVVMVGRLMLVELFRRYDTFHGDVGKLPLEPKVTLTSLTRAAAR